MTDHEGKKDEQSQRNFERDLGIDYGTLCSEENQEDYFLERCERIQKGESTWMVGNYDSDGYCVDYWVDKERVASLHIGGWEGYKYTTYADSADAPSKLGSMLY